MEKNELHLLSRLSAYTLKSFFIRIALVSGVGLLFLFVSIKIAGDDSIKVTLNEYLQVILIFNIISESNVFIDHLAERFLPIPEKISLRVSLHILVSLFIAISVIFYFSYIVKEALTHPIVQLMMLFGVIFIFILILISITLRITEKWIFSIRQLEELKSLKLKSDYNSLQAQLNPHFLFNNLSVLKSMITFDQEAAILFIQNFTDVYRYVLQSKNKKTVKLTEELDFIDAYTSIHKERMGKAFDVKKAINKIDLKKEIPPLALQQLVENAVKHNVALKNAPLTITIKTDGNYLSIVNNLNPKESSFSEKTGLKNLSQRYALLTDNPVLIKNDNNFFSVKIPLL